MKVCIEFEVDGAAFEDSWDEEVTAVLARARMGLIDNGRPPLGVGRVRPCILRDTNGNKVGAVFIDDE